MRMRLCFAIAVLAGLLVGTANAPAATIAGSCVSATNIGVIIDDSASMIGTDPDKLRVEALKLLMNKPGNANKLLGAVKFGDTASDMFAPTLIGPAVGLLGSTLDSQIISNGSSTDYNLAFSQTKINDPGADARIFLTDGGHNVFDFANGHVGGPKTYVIGVGIGETGEDGLRLQQIATETGGQYFPNVNTGDVQAVVNQIDAIINCAKAPMQFSDTFSKLSQKELHRFTIGSSAKSLDLVLTWADPTNSFAGRSFSLTGTQAIYAGASKKLKRKKLRITKTVGTTYVSYHLTGFRKGKLRFQLRASALAIPGAELTTQLTQNSMK